MNDDRLERIRKQAEGPYFNHTDELDYDDAVWLIEEVGRLRAELVEVKACAVTYLAESRERLEDFAVPYNSYVALRALVVDEDDCETCEDLEEWDDDVD